MMMATDFQKQISAFRDREKAKLLAIFRTSSQALAEEANVPKANGGKMPVDTGNLRNSQAGSTSGMPGASAQPVALALLSTKLGDTFYMGWTAAYALRMEHGFFGEDKLGRTYAQQGNGFARSAAQNWSFIVDWVAGEVGRRA